MKGADKWANGGEIHGHLYLMRLLNKSLPLWLSVKPTTWGSRSLATLALISCNEYFQIFSSLPFFHTLFYSEGRRRLERVCHSNRLQHHLWLRRDEDRGQGLGSK